ncbi:glycosyltransferase family 2 protein [Prochlorococcus sp. MIT 1307]|uniref:glycosyltransferase n=1 Tax=Prochlorococcus sp. MIT 1307 TaxID=3096219 RepID=UPI002A760E05|nr:glycosyltransferase family 2 protein [Prochlorococcus sp. MIT 1307]
MAAVAVTGQYRRGKTALFLIACCCAGAAPHWMESESSLWPVLILVFLLGSHGLRTVFLRDREQSLVKSNSSSFQLIDEKSLPNVDVLIAARDEEAVIERLVAHIASLSYPKEKISTWIIDDGSQDRTPLILEKLCLQHKNLHVIRRSSSAGGGKSGALNKALTKVHGDWLLILDADAQLQQDSLHRLVSYARAGGWSAVQLRKAVINASENHLTSFQAMEMAMDAVIQQGRLAGRGVVELRGNGQLLFRPVIDQCGGFNEDTVTDDLDLSFRLLISGALVGILWDPPVQEEGVGTIPGLWRQRQRWAEGGLQRFLDYWPLLMSNRLTFLQRWDLMCFFLLQYSLPIVSLFDLITSVVTRTMPVYWPLSIAAFSISGLAYWRGCRTISEGPELPSPDPFRLLMAIIYLGHWFVVIPWVTVRMAVFPKKLVWAKTNHHGQQTVQV